MTRGEIALLLRIETNDRVWRCPFYGALSISNDLRLRNACSGRRAADSEQRWALTPAGHALLESAVV